MVELLDQFTDEDGDTLVLFSHPNAPEWFVVSVYGGTQSEVPDMDVFDSEEGAREFYRGRVEYWQDGRHV